MANAPTFENVITLATPRTDIPTFPSTTCTQAMELRDMPLNGLQTYLLPLLVYNLSKGQLEVGSDGNKMIVKTMRARCRTKRDLEAYVAEFATLHTI